MNCLGLFSNQESELAKKVWTIITKFDSDGLNTYESTNLPKMIDELLELDYNFNTFQKGGNRTMFMYLCKHGGHLKLTEQINMIIKNGIDVNYKVKNKNGPTALLEAVSNS